MNQDTAVNIIAFALIGLITLLTILLTCQHAPLYISSCDVWR